MPLTKAYYTFKFLVPRRLQIQLRRYLNQKKRSKYKDIWPIDKNACNLPEGWSGWPDGKKFALVLTHDVETIKGSDKCNKLAEIEERLGFCSSFNFVAGDYKVPAALRQYLMDHGFEIGVHGLHHNNNPFRSKLIFQKQAIEINHYLKEWNSVGYRTPSMYHDLELLHHLNIEYDASTFDTDPFEPQSDGMGTIFPFWVPGNDNQKGYVELPYTLPQDFLLFILMQGKNIDIWKKKLDWIVDNGGMALFISHPDYMNFDKSSNYKEYPVKYYEEFLEYIKSKYKGQYWNPLPREMSHFWAGRYGVQTNKMKTTSLQTNELTSYHIATTHKPLRICMLAYSFYETDGRIRRYAETLARRGDVVEVIALRGEHQPYHEVIEGVHVFRIQKRILDEKGPFSYLFKLIKFLLLSMVIITKRHLKNPYNFIHVHSVPDFEVFATLFPKLLGAKIVLDIHDIVPEFYASKFNKTGKSPIFKMLAAIEKASIAFSDHVIISNHLWEKTLLSRSVSGQKCSVMMNYPDPVIFHRRYKSRKDNRFMIIYPGTLSWHQGLDIAVNAFSRIKDQVPHADFYIYGGGHEMNNLINLIKKHGLQGRVFIKDSVPLDQIAEIMANADLGIVPKRNSAFGGEAFSTKILEFMSLGVPVIVSDTKIDKYYFNDSVVKFFKSDDANDLSQTMISLIKDRELLDQFRKNALSFVDYYSWDKRKNEYLDLVDSLIGKEHS